LTSHHCSSIKLSWGLVAESFLLLYNVLMRIMFIAIAVILVAIGLMAFIRTFGNASTAIISFFYTSSVNFFYLLNIDESNMFAYGVISIIGAGVCVWFAYAMSQNKHDMIYN